MSRIIVLSSVQTTILYNHYLRLLLYNHYLRLLRQKQKLTTLFCTQRMHCLTACRKGETCSCRFTSTHVPKVFTGHTAPRFLTSPNGRSRVTFIHMFGSLTQTFQHVTFFPCTTPCLMISVVTHFCPISGNKSTKFK